MLYYNILSVYMISSNPNHWAINTLLIFPTTYSFLSPSVQLFKFPTIMSGVLSFSITNYLFNGTCFIAEIYCSVLFS